MRDEILALLEDGAHRAVELAEWLGQDAVTIVRALKQLAADGLVRRQDDGTTVTWVLTGRMRAPHQEAVQVPRRRTLRQPQPVSADGSSSWWVGKDREGLKAEIRQQQERMRGSKAVLSERTR